MKENKELDPYKIWQKYWLYLSLAGNAVSIINLQRDLFPALISWVSFFLKAFGIVELIRDIVLFPLTYISFELFNITLPSWLKTIIFILILSHILVNKAWKNILQIPFMVDFIKSGDDMKEDTLHELIWAITKREFPTPISLKHFIFSFGYYILGLVAFFINCLIWIPFFLISPLFALIISVLYHHPKSRNRMGEENKLIFQKINQYMLIIAFIIVFVVMLNLLWNSID